MEPSIHEPPHLSLPGQYPLCQGTKARQQYLVFLNHPVLVVLGGRLPGDHNCRPVPIVLSYWNTLRWSTRSCLVGKKDWTVKFAARSSELFEEEDRFWATQMHSFMPHPSVRAVLAHKIKWYRRKVCEPATRLINSAAVLLGRTGEVTLITGLSKLRYPLPECHSPKHCVPQWSQIVSPRINSFER